MLRLAEGMPPPLGTLKPTNPLPPHTRTLRSDTFAGMCKGAYTHYGTQVSDKSSEVELLTCVWGTYCLWLKGSVELSIDVRIYISYSNHRLPVIRWCFAVTRRASAIMIITFTPSIE